MKKDSCADTEMNVLAGIICHTDELVKCRSVLHRDLFDFLENKRIFDLTIETFENDRKVSLATLCTKLQTLGWTDKKNRPLDKYLEAICQCPPNEEDVQEFIYQLVDLHYNRKGKKTLKNIEDVFNQDLTLAEKYDEINKIYTDGMRVPVSGTSKPVKVWKNYSTDLEYYAANPDEKDEEGFDWPYETMNKQYGQMLIGEVSLVVARGGVGKSTVLSHVSDFVQNKYKVPVLIVDTEMQTHMVQHRAFARKSGVNSNRLRKNTWWKNESDKKKVYKAFDDINEEENLYHIYVGGKDFSEIEAIIENFYYTEVGHGNPFLLVYDYIKCDGNSVSEHRKEYQVLGDIIDRLDKMAKRLNCAILSAAQANRTGDSFSNRTGVADDTTAIGDSDRIQRYGGQIVILRRKMPDELILHESIDDEDSDEEEMEQRVLTNASQLRFGTHIWTCVKARHGGEEGHGHLDLVEITQRNGKTVSSNNFINITIDNFDVIDKGDARHMERMRSENHEILDDQDIDIEDIL